MSKILYRCVVCAIGRRMRSNFIDGCAALMELHADAVVICNFHPKIGHEIPEEEYTFF